MRKVLLVLAIIASGFLQIANANETFSTGTVTAYMIGPNESARKETNSQVYFQTRVKILGTKNNFAKELKGQEIELRTGSFDKKLLGQTVPLKLTRVEGRSSKPEYLLICSEINISMLCADKP